jgi:hypothetical protein
MRNGGRARPLNKIVSSHGRSSEDPKRRLKMGRLGDPCFAVSGHGAATGMERSISRRTSGTGNHGRKTVHVPPSGIRRPLVERVLVGVGAHGAPTRHLGLGAKRHSHRFSDHWPHRSLDCGHRRILGSSVACVATGPAQVRAPMTANNALELSAKQRGPRLAAARSLWPAAQQDR